MMKNINIFLLMGVGTMFFLSCSTLDKASMHGFSSGYYSLDSVKTRNKVYVDINDEKIDVYHQIENKVEKDKFLSLQLKPSDTTIITPLVFRKQSLDIDITTILLKYRPSVYDIPPQLNADLNFAIYAGWRFDTYKISGRTDPLGNRFNKISNFGFDFGLFAGPGTTPVNPFTTNNRTTNEYSGMIIQTGFAGFLESNIASFGLAIGFDYLLNSDKNIWIYNKKPWVGFIVGLALN